MKKILLRTFAFTFLAASMLVSCTSDNTTGVETDNTGTTTESQPNMGGRTGDSAELDSVPTNNGNTNQNNGNTDQNRDNNTTGTGNNGSGTGNNGTDNN